MPSNSDPYRFGETEVRASRGQPKTNTQNGPLSRGPIIATAAINLFHHQLFSIILGALPDPCSNGIAIAAGQLLSTMRHAQCWRGTPIQQQHQIAAFRFTGNDHWAKFSALHDAFITGKIISTFFVALSARLMAVGASPLKEWQNILRKTDALVCGT